MHNFFGGYRCARILDKRTSVGQGVDVVASLVIGQVLDKSTNTRCKYVGILHKIIAIMHNCVGRSEGMLFLVNGFLDE